jgi:PTH2 family peptidyl-tRNA hydrolase
MQSQNGNNSQNDLKKEILEFGFDEDKVDLALKMSNDKEEICNLIVKMMEEPEFYVQIKSNSQINVNQPSNNINNNNNNNNNNNLAMDFSNFIQQLSNNIQQYKMVIVVRKDLKMSVGKTSAQVAHAVLGAYKRSLDKNSNIVLNWENYSGQAKIVLGVENEKELMDIKSKADNAGLITCLIHDAGRTEVAPNTATCCAIGPDSVQKIDVITGQLKLL